MNEACRMCVRVCRDKSVSILKNKLDFEVRGNPDGEGFHWLFTKVNNHIGKPVSLWFG